MILACLRILTANLAEFIHRNNTTVMGSMAAHRSEEEQLNGVDLRVQRHSVLLGAARYEQQRENVYFGLPCMLLNIKRSYRIPTQASLGGFRLQRAYNDSSRAGLRTSEH